MITVTPISACCQFPVFDWHKGLCPNCGQVAFIVHLVTGDNREPKGYIDWGTYKQPPTFQQVRNYEENHSFTVTDFKKTEGAIEITYYRTGSEKEQELLVTKEEIYEVGATWKWWYHISYRQALIPGTDDDTCFEEEVEQRNESVFGAFWEWLDISFFDEFKMLRLTAIKILC